MRFYATSPQKVVVKENRACHRRKSSNGPITRYIVLQGSNRNKQFPFPGPKLVSFDGQRDKLRDIASGALLFPTATMYVCEGLCVCGGELKGEA